MKRTVLTLVLIFSLALNVAVAATMAWHVWQERKAAPAQTAVVSPLTSADMTRLKRIWRDEIRAQMAESRERIRIKKMEILDLIAKTPGDMRPAENSIQELAALRGKMERDALERISKIAAELPEGKREAFISYVKDRACMGPGMGPGRWKRRRGAPEASCCPVEALAGTDANVISNK